MSWARRSPALARTLGPAGRALLVAGAVATVACHGRPRSEGAAKGTPPAVAGEPQPRSGPAIAVLDFSGGLPEQSDGGLLGMGPKRRTFYDALRTLQKVKTDKEVRGLLVQLGQAPMGLARAQELATSLESIKKDKPIYCHADGYTNASLYAVSRGCSRVYVSPAGAVDAVGLAAQVVYMRRLLADELHLDIDFLQIGKFKGAEEPITRDGPSDEARKSLEGVLSDLRDTWLQGVSAGRGRPEVTAAAEDGPYGAVRSKERGLVDEVGYLDEARDQERAATGAVREILRFGPHGPRNDDDALAELVRALSGGNESTAPIALVRATGEISMSGGGGVLGGGGGITEKQLGKIIARVTRDDKVKAVVLRIDSPGGSALASDLLWHALMRLRAKKPIVVSVGEMAASGGYYLASTANVIFADAASIVGSIGVVGGKISGGKALERIGLHAETFPARRGDAAAAHRAAYESVVTAWDEPTRQRVRETMTGIYDLFLQRVAEGRKVPVDKIATSAEGRIFSGREGKERGLVDELGGLEAAIAKARELASLPAEAEVSVVDGAPAFLEALAAGGEGADELAPSVAEIPDEMARAWVRRLAPDAAVFAAALAPLAGNEHAVAALPFALTIR